MKLHYFNQKLMKEEQSFRIKGENKWLWKVRLRFRVKVRKRKMNQKKLRKKNQRSNPNLRRNLLLKKISHLKIKHNLQLQVVCLISSIRLKTKNQTLRRSKRISLKNFNGPRVKLESSLERCKLINCKRSKNWRTLREE